MHHLQCTLLIRLTKVSFYHYCIPAEVIGMQFAVWNSCLEFPRFPRYKHRQAAEKLERQTQDKEKIFVNHIHSSLVGRGI